jgi:hypothetical protein
MEITYRLTREDHLRYARLVVARAHEHAGWRGSPVVVALAYGVALLAALHLAHLAFGPLDGGGWIVAGLAFMTGTLFTLLCTLYFQRLIQRNFLSDESPSLGEVRLKLDNDGIAATSAAMATKYSWQAIKELSEAGSLLIMWIDRGQGIVVPKGAFASQEARQSFIGAVREQVARGRT